MVYKSNNQNLDEMKNKFLFILDISIVLNSCKSRTGITVQVFNPLIQQNVPNAEVVLIERKSAGGVFSPSSECREIANATTGKEGKCFFDGEKLKTAKKSDYFCAIKKSWQLEQSYPCSGKTSGFIDVGKSTEVILIDDLPRTFIIEYNKLFSPSIPGDSLIVFPKRLEFPNPKGGTVGGGGVSGGGKCVSSGTNNYPDTFSGQPNKLSGIVVLSIRKRKLGVLTTTFDTIIALPNTITKAQINW